MLHAKHFTFCIALPTRQAKEKISFFFSKAVLIGTTASAAVFLWNKKYTCGLAAICEEIPSSATPTTISARLPITPNAAPSLLRQQLYRWNIWSLPLLPRRLATHDPILTLPQSKIRQRARDEVHQQSILQRISNLIHEYQKDDKQSNASTTNHEILKERQQQIASLQQSWLNIVFGSNVTLQDRQLFLERYGCTAWTEDIIQILLELGSRCGIVEIGAGNGQWARILTDRYKQHQINQPTHHNKRNFDFVLAYDDGSRLPLDPKVYHARTKPTHDYFYNKVQNLHAGSISATITQWICRGRILLLVYPPADSDMAFTAVQAYDRVNTESDKVIVYVGEGRGGANANDAFFDYLEHNEWILDKVLQVKPFGSKGYEQMYVFCK